MLFLFSQYNHQSNYKQNQEHKQKKPHLVIIKTFFTSELLAFLLKSPCCIFEIHRFSFYIFCNSTVCNCLLKISTHLISNRIDLSVCVTIICIFVMKNYVSGHFFGATSVKCDACDMTTLAVADKMNRNLQPKQLLYDLARDYLFGCFKYTRYFLCVLPELISTLTYLLVEYVYNVPFCTSNEQRLCPENISISVNTWLSIHFILNSCYSTIQLPVVEERIQRRILTNGRRRCANLYFTYAAQLLYLAWFVVGVWIWGGISENTLEYVYFLCLLAADVLNLFVIWTCRPMIVYCLRWHAILRFALKRHKIRRSSRLAHNLAVVYVPSNTFVNPTCSICDHTIQILVGVFSCSHLCHADCGEAWKEIDGMCPICPATTINLRRSTYGVSNPREVYIQHLLRGALTEENSQFSRQDTARFENSELIVLSSN